QAIGASRKDSKLFSFTDASAKDAGLANSVNAAAQAKRIRITHLLTGSCSPIDPVYFANAEETGGQLFLLNQFQGEVGKIFDLVRPDRKSTRLNSSHEWISYAVFCLKKKTDVRATLAPISTSLDILLHLHSAARGAM